MPTSDLSSRHSVQDLASHFAPAGAYVELDRLIGCRFLCSQLNINTIKPSKALLSGPVKTRFKGRGMEFEEVRLYQPGDDIRTIDWRVTARTQVPHTKIYKEERERPIFVLVDQRSSMFFGSRVCFKSVYAAHLAAMLGWMAIGQNDRIGALIASDTQHHDVRPRRSKHAQLELLHGLVAANHGLTAPFAEQSQPLEEILKEAQRIVRPGNALLVISDFHDFSDNCAKQLHLLSRHCDLTLFHVYDAMEAHLPTHDQLTVSNGLERLVLNTRSKAVQQAFDAQFSHRRQQLQKCADGLAIALVDAPAHESPSDLLRAVYGRQDRRMGGRR
ncbi:DUF58 domain-containing protein [Marinibactrum halimedae]|uniref:DUF58 domain-containing protein n=1 Tax=Marinibactrum halimedae TaxID=1444977 RepID=A0AA37TCC3_9GAMM|nr:DUF58 domain-containing protein [Marinibactrum halimedae]MCD9458585.1 DUF58 domain-containing protein [Marinibactrum halimedae]GLS26547.1 hypothetical protein GCM10007877_22630 [Marinibactrum halimedae]